MTCVCAWCMLSMPSFVAICANEIQKGKQFGGLGCKPPQLVQVVQDKYLVFAGFASDVCI